MSELTINYKISEKNLDRKLFQKIQNDLRKLCGPNLINYGSVIPLDEILKKNNIQIFSIPEEFGDGAFGLAKYSSLMIRWRKLGEDLEERSLMTSPDESYTCILSRHQILSMNTWERVDDFLDKSSSIWGGVSYGKGTANEGGTMYLPSNLRGWIKFMEGFEDYFLKEWLES